MRDPIPVTLLTGYLGSGKTTLLNQLVAHHDMQRSLVIINEFGDIGLDHLLVSHSREELVIEMSNGCVCCTVRKDLAKTLQDILWRFSSDGVRQFDRVVIETTGLADPVPIVHTLITTPRLASNYRLDGILAVVDAATGNTTLDQHQEGIRQVAIADRLLVTKTDLVTPEALAAFSARLQALNPAARQVQVQHGALAPADILGLGLFDAARKIPDVARWLNQEAYSMVGDGHIAAAPSLMRMGRKPPMAKPDTRQAQTQKHDARIRAFCHVVDEPLPARLFDAWIATLVGLAGQNLLRMKGIVNVKGANGPVVIHGVQHIFHPPAFLPAWPSADRRTRIVFITQDIDPKVIAQTLTQLAGAATPAEPDSVAVEADTPSTAHPA